MNEAESSTPPPLLHSLEELASEILDCLGAVQAKRIVEIGSETGGFSLRLADWAAEHGAVLVTVDPEPAPQLRRAAEESDHIEVVADASPWALEGLAPADAYIVDGDHNHWTVTRELQAAFAHDARPLVVLHDVGWPCARRDEYYAPDRLPAEAVHEHTYHLGLHPGREEAGLGGFRGAGVYASATREGGERNGVLTAVEDFAAERGGLRFLRIPSVFGVGFLFPEDAPWAAAVSDRIGPLDEQPLLDRLEYNRLVLYTRVLDLQDDVEAVKSKADRMLSDLHERLGTLEAENARLRLEAAAAAPG